MPKSKVIKSYEPIHFFKESAIPNLRTYFGRVLAGQPNVYDTPFAKGESTAELLNSWNETLVSIQDEWPSLYEFETDMASKVGPLSVMLPLDERLSDVEDYYTGILLPSEPIPHSAEAAVIGEWNAVRGLRPQRDAKTVEGMKLSTNSGSPYFTKRRDALNKPMKFRPQWDGTTLTDRYENCAVLGWRGQEGGHSKEDVKQRVVWMFPFAVNIQELNVYQPLIAAAQRRNIIPAWVSMEAVDRRITDLFDTKASNDLVVCTDFTKFDQHFNKHLQQCSENIIREIFTAGETVWWLVNVFPIKYTIPMALDMHRMAKGEHGMGSGSGGTNADETLAHRALQYAAAQYKGVKLNPNSQCLGDDGILSYPGITVEDVTEAYTKHGLEMNVSKQYASTNDCTYLRRWHHAQYRKDGVCVGVYSTNRALGRLRYLERFQDPKWWGPKAVALRQLSIIENVKYHPLANDFAEFCMKRDKFRLGLDIPGFLDSLPEEVKKANEHMPDFLGYTKTLQEHGDPTHGINSWWIVNYLKSKR